LNTRIEETIQNFEEEKEEIIIDISGYYMSINNLKGLIVHKRLIKLLNIMETIKISNKYYYLNINKENINKIRKSKFINYLFNNKELINQKGAFLLDKFYEKKLNEEILDFKKKKEEDNFNKLYKKINKAQKVIF
jgi:hypothetical protein